MTLNALFQGWVGELQTKLAQGLFLDSKKYRTFNNIIIQSGPRSTQIDHVIVSKYGIFVAETKNRRGWIFGSPDAELWTQRLYKRKIQFQNPLRQNYAHTRSLSEFLGIDHSKVFSVIIFWGDCKFKTPMPDNVLRNKYTPYIKSKTEILFSENEVNGICLKLHTLKASTPFLAGWHHAKSINKRYSSSTTCPKCGGKLLERIAQKGKIAGNKFLGCENYPRCRYTRNLN